jgi:hypothetical protein
MKKMKKSNSLQKNSVFRAENRLSLNQMENIVAGGPGRKCLLLGGLTFLSIALGPVAFVAAAMYTSSECA